MENHKKFCNYKKYNMKKSFIQKKTLRTPWQKIFYLERKKSHQSIETWVIARMCDYV